MSLAGIRAVSSVVIALAIGSSACTPKVGIARADASMDAPARGPSVMVVPGDAVEGAAGDRIELTAWGFTAADRARVSFGSRRAAEVRVIDGWRIEVLVPPGTGVVDVCIENAAGAWVLLEAFRYPGAETRERCWPESVASAQVDAARRRIAEAREERAGRRLADAR